MASTPTPRSRRSSVPGALMVGLGATLVVPAAAQADPDPEPSTPTPSVSKLDPSDQALAHRAQADRPTPPPVKPTPPPNAGTPPGDRTGDASDYEPDSAAPPGDRTGNPDDYAPTPVKAKPAPAKPRAPKPAKPKAAKPDKPANPGTPPGDRTGDSSDYTPQASKPKPKPAKAKAAKPDKPANPGTPPGDRTGKPANYTPPKAAPNRAGTPPGDRTGRPASYTPPTATPQPANPGTPPGDRTGNGANYTPPTPAATVPGAPAGDRTGNPASYTPPKAAPTRPGAPAGDRTGNPANYTPPKAAPTRPGAPAGDRTGDPANYTPPTSAPTVPGAPAGDRTGDPANYTPPKAAPTRGGAPAGDRTADPADYPSSPVGTPPPGDRTGDGRDYPTVKPPATPFDATQLLGPRIQRMGRGDQGPDQYPYVIEIGTGPDPRNATPPKTLEFPGGEGQRISVTTTCSASGRSSRTATFKCTVSLPANLPNGYKGRHRATPLVPTVDASYTRTSGRTANTMTPGGERATIQVTSEQLARIGAEGGLKVKGVQVKASYKRIAGGHKTVYQITSTPARIAEIQKNSSAAPQANDPNSIRPGDALLLTEENFNGNEGKAEVKNVQLEASRVKGDRQSAGVQRVGKSTIRITVGKEKFVRTVLRAGAGSDLASIGLYSSGDEAEGGLRQVDLDVGTKTGWDLYQKFLATGRVAYRPKLAFNITDRRTWDVTNGLYGKFGPVDVSTTGSHKSGDLRRVRNSDGSVDEVTTVSSDKATFYSKDKTNADGTAAPTEGYLLIENASSEQTREYRKLSGGSDADGKIDGEGSDVKVKFTEQDLDTLREVAIKRIRRTGGELLRRDLSRKDVEQASGETQRKLTSLTTEFNIVNAKTPIERLYALYIGQGGRNDQLFDILLDTNPKNKNHETPVPGSATVLND